MGKNIFVDGSVYATTGDLYTRDIASGKPRHPEDSEIIAPPGGVWYITEDTGSIFDTYYVNGGVTASGISGESKGAICAYVDIFKFAVRDYTDDMKLIERMLNHIPNGANGVLYLQQQYASVFSLMERFLSYSFVHQTCDREESYHKVLESGLLQKRFTTEKKVLNGPDCLEKELLYIKVANRIVYHRHSIVSQLFKAAFDINVDLYPLERQLGIRNSIMHRFGYSEYGMTINISEIDVRDLMVEVDKIVLSTADQLLALPPTEHL